MRIAGYAYSNVNFRKGSAKEYDGLFSTLHFPPLYVESYHIVTLA
jgi:hypothetical protein